MTLTPAKAKLTSTPKKIRAKIVKNKMGVNNSMLIITHLRKMVIKLLMSSGGSL